MNRAESLRDAASRLAEAGIESPRREARLLWEHAHQFSLSPIGGEGWGEGETISARTSPPHAAPLPLRGRGDVSSVFESLVARRIAREPFAYIVGHREFWSLDFEVGPGALVPRPETETLIEEALKTFPDRAAPLRILDLGTGSGCLLVTALTLYTNASGTGIDRSTEALAWARRNLTRHGVESRATLIEGDWATALCHRFDLVFSNPPYLTTAEMAERTPELGWEPDGALMAGPDGLDAYRALGPVIAGVLAPGGRAFIEIGAGQSLGASAALAAAGLEIAAIAPDLSGIPRCIAARLRA